MDTILNQFQKSSQKCASNNKIKKTYQTFPHFSSTKKMESLIEKREDDDMKDSEGEKNAEEMSENEMEEEDEEFFEDFYDENIKK